MSRLSTVAVLLVLPVVALHAAVAWPPSVSFDNGFIYIIPLVAWNAVFWNSIRLERFFEGQAPQPVLAAELVARVFAFAYPIFLVTERGSEWYGPGMAVYLGGTAIYFASWLALAYGNERFLSDSPVIQFAPTYTPMLAFAGIAMLTESSLYLAGTGLFTILHVTEYVFTIKRR